MNGLSREGRLLAAILVITIPTIEIGGAFLLWMIRVGDPSYLENAVRGSLFRAGHAHAGVLVLLALIVQVLADSARLGRGAKWIARAGAPFAAIVMPLGFFVSVAPPDAVRPNGWISLVYLGAIVLAGSLLTLGVGLIRSLRASSAEAPN